MLIETLLPNKVCTTRCAIAVGFALVGVFLVNLQFASAQEPEPNSQTERKWHPDTSVIWRSENKNSTELASSITKLYRTLCQNGLLPTKVVENPEGLTLSEIMVRDQAYIGPVFSQEVDELLCALNPDHCESQRKRKDANNSIPKDTPPLAPSDITCGFEVLPSNSDPERYRPQWSNRPNESVVIPDIQFEPTVTFQSHQRVTPQNITDVFEQAAACPLEPKECQRLTEDRNWRSWNDFLQGNFAGVMKLPTLGARAVVDLPSNSRIFDELKSHLVIHGSAKSNSRAQDQYIEDVRARQAEVYVSINHPAYSLTEEHVGVRTETVVVFDRWVDPDHCALDQLRLLRVHNIKSRSFPRGLCRDFHKNPEPWHHGTHIVGILAADNHQAGLLTFSDKIRVVSYELKFEPFFDVEWNAGLFVGEQSPFSYRPSVFNLSFGYERAFGTSDPFRNAIADLEDDAVVVVAAGNENQVHQKDGQTCPLLPACWGRDSQSGERMSHVISVVALNENKEVWTNSNAQHIGSNHGTWFDLAAPGSDIPSTIGGDRIGRMSGTSQATAIVSGAAAMLMSKGIGRVPSQARNRLIYTGDISSDLYDKVYGGSLNLSRALRIEEDVVALREGARVWGWPGKHEITGEDVVNGNNKIFGKITNGKCKIIYLEDEETDKGQFAVKFEQIKRFIFEPTYDEFLAFYSKDRNDVTNLVERRRVGLRHPDRTAYRISIRTSIDGQARVVKFRISDIQDYVTRTKNGGFDFQCSDKTS